MNKSDLNQRLKLFREFFCKEFCEKHPLYCKNTDCLIKDLNYWNANTFEIKDLFENGNDEKWQRIVFIQEGEEHEQIH